MRKIKVVVLLVRQLQHGFTKNAKVSPNFTVAHYMTSMVQRHGVVFMSGGITYDGHISMLGITELEVSSSENSYSRAP